MAKGPVAVIECIQEIPCNPCETACPRGAVKVDQPITNLPVLDGDKCTGCGLCIPGCPGLAIFLLDMTYSSSEASLSFPHEYLPLPDAGQTVAAVDRAGRPVCEARVLKVSNPARNDQTPVITIAVPRQFSEVVRGIARKSGGQGLDDDTIVCRCEEITLGDVRKAIREGARDLTGVKRRTRAGMGLCQGRTCENLVVRILCEELGLRPAEVAPGSVRPPVVPVPFGVLAGDEGR